MRTAVWCVACKVVLKKEFVWRRHSDASSCTQNPRSTRWISGTPVRASTGISYATQCFQVPVIIIIDLGYKLENIIITMMMN